MIANATISRIDQFTGANVAGGNVFSTGVPIALPSCLLGITSNQRFTLGATIKDSTNSLYIDKQDLADAALTPPALGDRVLIAPDLEPPVLYVVLATTDNTLDLVSHFELFLKLV